jgi:hypothetical protein
VDIDDPSCYDLSMRAFVCEIDDRGVNQFLPEHFLAAEELARLAHLSPQPTSAIVWALLEEPDAEAMRTEIGAGRGRDAYDLLLNRAIEILPIALAVPDVASNRVVSP